jgi:hypothetical protein
MGNFCIKFRIKRISEVVIFCTQDDYVWGNLIFMWKFWWDFLTSYMENICIQETLYLDYATTASFRILSNLSFAIHSTLCRLRY